MGLDAISRAEFIDLASAVTIPEWFREQHDRLRKLNSFLLKRIHPDLPGDPTTQQLEKFPEEDAVRLAFIGRTMQLLREEEAHIKGKPRPKLTGY